MRKASKDLIKINLAAFDIWVGKTGEPARVSATPGAESYVRDEQARARARIMDGDCTATTQALLRHIHRTITRCIAGEIVSIKQMTHGASFELRGQRDINELARVNRDMQEDRASASSGW